MSKHLGGVHTALITPFSQNLQIDWESFDKILDDQKQAGVTGVIISGTTGESPTLSVQEKLSLIRRARARLPAEILVIAGSGSNNTEQSIELSRLSAEAGADALLLVTPPYNKPGMNGLKEHFRQITSAVEIPSILYHVPSRTGQLLTADEIAEICEIPGVEAIKEASANLHLFSKTRILTDCCLMSGDDPTFLSSLAVGGEGVVSVVTNVFPKAFVAIYESFKNGRNQEAAKIHQALLPFIESLFCESNPGPAKAAMTMRGLCQNHLRLPLTVVEDRSWNLISKCLTLTTDKLKTLGV